MDTCSHSPNNIPPNKKTCSISVLNLIYIFIHSYMNQLLMLIKIIYF